MPKAWKNILQWLERVHYEPGFGEVSLVFRELGVDEVAGLEKLSVVDEEEETES